MKLVVSVLLVFCLIYDTKGVQFNIQNLDGGPIWIGILGNPGKPHLENGGFKLPQGASRSINAPDDWAGRFWSRTWCYEDRNNHCLTGDCGNKVECAGAGGVPPVTLVEITLKGDAGLNYYDISLVDGYNTQASIQPVNGQGDCRKAGCGTQINDRCPSELQIRNDGEAQVIACKSSCLAFNTDQYCCRGAYNSADTCKPADWPVNSAKVFKDACPDAYSYAYDDKKSLLTCKANEYNIKFGAA